MDDRVASILARNKRARAGDVLTVCVLGVALTLAIVATDAFELIHTATRQLAMFPMGEFILAFIPWAVLGLWYAGRRISDQRELVETMEGVARIDPLTGIANRAEIDDALDREVVRSQRYRHPLSVLMIDIDHFKSINDRYGHPVGDTVIRNVAKAIAGRLRSTDLVARYGGEEFLVMLTETAPNKATTVAEAIRNIIAEIPVYLKGDTTIQTTVSIGVSGALTITGSAADLVRQADQALYAAKNGGRNQVRVQVPPEPPRAESGPDVAPVGGASA